MNNIIKRVWIQNRLVNIEDLTGMVFQAEIGAHTFEISGIDDTGAAVALSGTVSGVFRRPDNADIALTGAASGGVVSVTLPADCYAVPGRFGLTIFVTSNSQKVAVYACVGTVAVSSTGNVAGDTPANVEDLIDDINAAIADLNSAIGSIPADYSQFMAAIAPAYSSSALYAIGSYAWHDGTLYRCKTAITTAETWTAAHWEAAVLGDDVSDLKSAVKNNESEYIDFSMRVLNDAIVPNDFIYGRYLSGGFANVTNYARNNLPYPPGKYEIGPYAARGFVAVEYISDTEGSTIIANWVTAKQTITATRPWYITFNYITGDADISAINSNFVVKRISTVNDTLENQIKEIKEIASNFDANYSTNRYDGKYTVGGYIAETSGVVAANTGHSYSSWIDVSNYNGANIVISNTHANNIGYSNLRYAFYNAEKTFISGGMAPTLANDAELNRDYAVFNPPSGTVYMRFSLPNVGFTAVNDWQVQYTEVTKYYPYFTDYSGVSSDSLNASPAIKMLADMSYGIIPGQAKADTLSDGEMLVVENNSVMKNQCISFFANIDGAFSGVWVGHGLESYGYYIIVDGTNMTYGSNGSTGTAIPHGLTISEFIGVTVEVDVDLNIKTTITTAGGTFTRTQQINSSWRGDVFAKSIETTFTNAVLTWNCDDYKCPFWAFGDSYFTLYTPTRWPYYVAKKWGYDNILLNAYPGEASARAYKDFLNALAHGRPKYLLWCLGMNDPDNSNSINSTWLQTVENIKVLCDAYNIELILTTIPNVTNTAYNNTYKNAWIETSGIRYVDFASALADITGWLSDDGVHPSEIGGRFMALKLLADVPEIYQGK